uniref:CNH domain-containing protein n=1 Tax=Heterorhabditis bacteriophora TaxID=37862 RepID=A0A1I7WSB4_HETBA
MKHQKLNRNIGEEDVVLPTASRSGPAVLALVRKPLKKCIERYTIFFANPRSQLHDIDWSGEVLKRIQRRYYPIHMLLLTADVYHDVCASSTRLHILQVTQKRTVVQSISLLIAICDRDIISTARTGSEKTVTDSSGEIIEGLPTKDGSFNGGTSCGVLRLFLSNEQYYVLENLVCEGWTLSKSAQIVHNLTQWTSLESHTRMNTSFQDLERNKVEVMFSHKYPENRLLLAKKTSTSTRVCMANERLIHYV